MINKEIEKENIQHIKEVLTTYKDYIMEFDNDNLCVANVLQYIDQLENKVKEVEEVAQERDMYKKQLNDAFSRGFIHKSKIEEKIQEKKNRIEKLHPASDCEIIYDIETEIKALKELL